MKVFHSVAEAGRALAGEETDSLLRLTIDDLCLRLLGVSDHSERTQLHTQLMAERTRLMRERQQRGRSSPPDALSHTVGEGEPEVGIVPTARPRAGEQRPYHP